MLGVVDLYHCRISPLTSPLDVGAMVVMVKNSRTAFTFSDFRSRLRKFAMSGEPKFKRGLKPVVYLKIFVKILLLRLLKLAYRLWDFAINPARAAVANYIAGSVLMKNILRWFGRTFLKPIYNMLQVRRWKKRAFDLIMAIGVARLQNRNGQEIPASPRQILMFGDMGIGNFLMFTPTLRAFRTTYPEAEIVVLFLKGRGAEVVAKGNEDIDRLEIIDTSGRAGLRQFARLLTICRRKGISPDISVTRWNGSPYPAMLNAWLNPKVRVGHASGGGFKGYCDQVFNFPVVMTEEAHEVERNLDLARALGIVPSSTQMKMPVSDLDRAKADKLMVERGFDPERLICLQTGSSALQAWKRWPRSKWVDLSIKLDELGYDLAFVGSKDESTIAASIIDDTPFNNNGRKVNICGDLSLNATAAFIEKSRGMVCNDSGLMHIAAAVGTPIVGLFGPTEFDRTRPYVDNCVLLRNPCHCNHGTLFDRSTLAKIEACDRPCLTDTSPEQVIEAVHMLMPIAQTSPRQRVSDVQGL